MDHSSPQVSKDSHPLEFQGEPRVSHVKALVTCVILEKQLHHLVHMLPIYCSGGLPLIHLCATAASLLAYLCAHVSLLVLPGRSAKQNILEAITN